MKMSEAMKLAGYNGIPGGTELIKKAEAREAAKPKFQLPTLPVVPISRIFDCIKGDDEHFGAYITRDDADLEVVIEVKGWTAPDEPSNDPGGPIFGHAWTLKGELVTLSPEEFERLADDWRKMMESRAEREALENAHDADL